MTNEEIRYLTILGADGETIWTATTRWFSTTAATLDEARAHVHECLEDHFEKSRLNFVLHDDLVVYRHPASPQAREGFRVG